MTAMWEEQCRVAHSHQQRFYYLTRDDGKTPVKTLRSVDLLRERLAHGLQRYRRSRKYRLLVLIYAEPH
jgi:hypothetical protein